jgi:CTP synthase
LFETFKRLGYRTRLFYGGYLSWQRFGIFARDQGADEVYGVPEESERHRHRYEVTNSYRDQIVANGLRISGVSPDGSLVEIVELENHPWFIGVQFHPELRSSHTPPSAFCGVHRGRRRRKRRAATATAGPALVEAAD